MTNRILEKNEVQRGSKKIDTIDTAQLEYTATTMLTYGTIVFAVVLGLGSITYMTIQQLKK
jgi:preprotein translocase subunit SecF